MYAVVRTGNRQYRVSEGDVIDVERLSYKEDESFRINDVLLICNETKTYIGLPNVEGASIGVTVEKQYRAPKIIVFKYRQRTNYRRKRGHRQYYTRLRVNDICVGEDALLSSTTIVMGLPKDKNDLSDFYNIKETDDSKIEDKPVHSLSTADRLVLYQMQELGIKLRVDNTSIKLTNEELDRLEERKALADKRLALLEAGNTELKKPEPIKTSSHKLLVRAAKLGIKLGKSE